MSGGLPPLELGKLGPGIYIPSKSGGNGKAPEGQVTPVKPAAPTPVDLAARVAKLEADNFRLRDENRDLLLSVALPDVGTPISRAEAYLAPDEILEAFNRAETGDAEILAKLQVDHICYDHSEEAWLYWDGKHWQIDDKRAIGACVANEVAAQYLFYAAEIRKTGTGSEKDRKMIKDLVARANLLRYRGRINNVLTLAASQPKLALTGNEWDANPMWLGVGNGILKLRLDEFAFMPAAPWDYVRTFAPTNWEGLNSPAPRWEQFLREIFADDGDLIALVRRLFGYGLTGLTTEHILPVLWGEGRNGKDTKLEAVAHVLGDLAAPVQADVLMDGKRLPGSATPHLVSLRGKRLAWVSESNEGARFNAGQLKLLTGGGTIPARPLYGRPITFKPQHLLLLVTNFKPHASADDYALWERLLLIPFTEKFVENPHGAHEHKKDPKLADKLKAEAPGILAWLVRGCIEWQEQGLNPPASVRTATEGYQAEEDEIAGFIAAKCVTAPNAEAKGGALYGAYKVWAESSGFKAMNMTAFGRRLSKRFDKRKSGEIIYQGIGLLAEPEGLG